MRRSNSGLQSSRLTRVRVRCLGRDLLPAIALAAIATGLLVGCAGGPSGSGDAAIGGKGGMGGESRTGSGGRVAVDAASGSGGAAGTIGGSGGATGAGGGSGGVRTDAAADTGTDARGGANGGSDAGVGGAVAPVFAVTTNRYDNARSGVNPRETILTTANVNAARFGLLFSRAVDGQLYAQPLFLPAMTMADRKVHDVVYVATEHNTVYAFDATDAVQNTPLWSLNVGPSGSNTCDNMSPEIGISSTPVIDQARGVIYFLSKGQEGGNWVQRLHAVDLIAGTERSGSPVLITASVKGTGVGASGGNIAFDPGTQLNRTGLLLEGGVVYAAFASHCDVGPYHGWILGYTYDGSAFKQVLAFNVSPNGTAGGIWQAGNGLSSDGSNIFVVAGNGSSNPAANALDLSESVFKLRISDYTVQDYWLPTAYKALNAADSDLSSGAVLVAHSLLLTGSKDGRLYVLDSANLGKYNATADNILQTLTMPGKANGARGHVHGGAIYYAGPAGEKVYLWPEDSPLMAYNLNASTRTLGGLMTDPIPTASFTPGHPGATMTLSSNGSAAGTGILWATFPTQNGIDGAWHTTSAGALYAIDASDISNVLWGDNTGMWNVAKFAPPVVANGHVYVGTFSHSLRVYGLVQ